MQALLDYRHSGEVSADPAGPADTQVGEVSAGTAGLTDTQVRSVQALQTLRFRSVAPDLATAFRLQK